MRHRHGYHDQRRSRLQEFEEFLDTKLQIRRIWREINEMRSEMEAAEQEQYDRGAVLVGLIKAEFASVHGQLDEALAGADSQLKADSLADAERIKGLLDELATVLPADVPDVPVPDPGQPAEVPTEDTPVQESPEPGPAPTPDEPVEG